MSRRIDSSLRLARLVPVLVLGACSSLLGIEDIHEDPNLTAGSSGSNSTSAQGGDENSGGSTSTTNAMGGNGGAGDGLGGSGAVGPGGSDSGGGDGNLGGSTDPGGGTVRGTLVDFWGNKVPNVPIQVGDTITNTDEDGAFVVEDVPATYDVSVAFDFGTEVSLPRLFGYVYQGLTRRDPTIQVRQGLEIDFARAQVALENITITDGEKVLAVVGGGDGNTSLGSVDVTNTPDSIAWEGESTTQQTAHALHVVAAEDFGSPPTAYKAYDTALVPLSDSANEAVDVLLDMTAEAIPSGNLQGTVTGGGNASRYNQVFLRFTTGAALQLVEDNGPSTFSYLVPSLPGSSITVVAAEVESYDFGPYALVHADGLSASDSPTLKIPTPVNLVGPADGKTNVTAETKFSFTAHSSNAGPYVVRFENQDSREGQPFQYLWVITANKEVTIPEVLDGGFALRPGSRHFWQVETHGNFASVDAMAGPEGYLDPFLIEDEPVGPDTGSGEFTLSGSREFFTAP